MKTACKESCLSAINPMLTKEWHPDKNGDLTPKDVTPGSGKKVWWLCKKGHAWDSVVSSRNNGSGCPCCSGRRACKDNCLKTVNPAIAKQWHPTQNGELTPNDVTPRSSKKIWWLCSKGHSYEQIINQKYNRGYGCPICSGQKVHIDNCLATLQPELAKQWHPTKNVKLTPNDVTPGSNKKAWFICPRGHSTFSIIKNRSGGSGCFKCSNRTSLPEKRTYCELVYLFSSAIWQYKIEGVEIDIFIPELGLGVEYDGAYFHKSKRQNDITKNQKLNSLGINLLRVREIGLSKIHSSDVILLKRHISKIDINNLLRSIHSRFAIKLSRKIDSYISQDSFMNENLYNSIREIPIPLKQSILSCKFAMKMWDYKGNMGINPRYIPKYSTDRVFWCCSKGHNFNGAVCSRTSGSGCPYCHNLKVCKDNSLATLRPEIAQQWHPTKNGKLTPDDVTSCTNNKAWWICGNSNLHDHEQAISLKTLGALSCPFCTGKRVCQDNCLATIRPDLAKEWHPSKNGKLTPNDVTQGSNKKVWWECASIYKHDYQATICNRSANKSCPVCLGKRSSPENSLATLRPEIALQWHPTKNGKLTPDDITPGSNKKVWWTCNYSKLHIHDQTISSKTRGSLSCPYCTGKRVCEDNCLATIRPDLAKEWHPSKNGTLTPNDVTPGSHKKVWWLCSKGHSYEQKIGNKFYKNYKCTYCSGKHVCQDNCLATIRPDLAKEWHPIKNGKLTPYDIIPKSQKKVWWKCKYGHSYHKTPSHRIRGQNCPKCRMGG